MLWNFIKLKTLTETQFELDFLKLQLLDFLNWTDSLYKDIALEKYLKMAKILNFLIQPLTHESLTGQAEKLK